VRILGVDPGLAATGYGIVDWVDGRATVGEAGVINTTETDDLAERVHKVYREVAELIAQFRPDAMAVEGLYADYEHPRTAVLMGHARGVMLLAAAQHGIPVTTYPPARIKKAITGNGSASKEQVQRMVQTLLGLAEQPMPDHVSDALAAALCHGATVGA